MSSLLAVAMAEESVSTLESRLAKIDARMSKGLESELAATDAELQELRSAIGEGLALQQRLAADAAALSERIKHLEIQAKTSGYRDQSQIEQNLDLLAGKLAQIEDRELSVMLEIDEMRLREVDLANRRSELVAAAEREREALETERRRLTAELDSARRSLEAALSALDADQLKLYRQRSRPVFAIVEKGVCRQCHLQLTRTAIEHLLSGRQVDCDGCGRWLVNMEEGL